MTRITIDNLGNDIRMWNPECDVLVTNEKTFLTGNDTASSGDFFNWAYSINTAKGLFRKSEEKTISVEEKIGPVTISLSQSVPIDLLLDDGQTCQVVMNNIAVWGTRYYDVFLIFSHNETKQTFIIDSRGTIFELPCDSNSDIYGNGGSVKIDRRNGCYLVNGIKVYYRTHSEQMVFAEASEPIPDAILNKEFNKFCRNNAHNTEGYLYLTAGQSKCGSFVSYFAENGMRYEIVPNILCDDDTVNVRIPLDPDNASRKDVQFLCAKYHNSYAIYGIPFEEICGGFEFPKKWKQKQRELGFFMPKGKDAIIYSIIDTLRIACGVDDDYEVFKKTFSKVMKLFERGEARPESNEFLDIMLIHPSEREANDAYILSRVDYINKLIEQSGYTPEKRKKEHLDLIESLKADGFDTSTLENVYSRIDRDDQATHIAPEDLIRDFDDAIEGRGKHYNSTLYNVAYEETKKQYKEAMVRYESDTLSQMASRGISINKWKSESSLFVTISKEYPDAIYQYHADWLGMQSLDIYVPSLNMGFEYQGEQHYRPVDFFGGEVAFRDLVLRDKRKAKLCAERGVKLVYWKYDEPITKSKLLKKISEAKQ